MNSSFEHMFIRTDAHREHEQESGYNKMFKWTRLHLAEQESWAPLHLYHMFLEPVWEAWRLARLQENLFQLFEDVHADIRVLEWREHICGRIGKFRRRPCMVVGFKKEVPPLAPTGAWLPFYAGYFPWFGKNVQLWPAYRQLHANTYVYRHFPS